MHPIMHCCWCCCYRRCWADFSTAVEVASAEFCSQTLGALFAARTPLGSPHKDPVSITGKKQKKKINGGAVQRHHRISGTWFNFVIVRNTLTLIAFILAPSSNLLITVIHEARLPRISTLFSKIIACNRIMIYAAEVTWIMWILPLCCFRLVDSESLYLPEQKTDTLKAPRIVLIC